MRDEARDAVGAPFGFEPVKTRRCVGVGVALRPVRPPAFAGDQVFEPIAVDVDEVQCVGLGDAFDVVILALPVYKNGAIGLQQVKVSSDGKTGYYIRRVCSAMETSLTRDFRYALEHDAQAMLENPAVQPNYKREVRRFNVGDIRVTGDALVLPIDFELTVK